MMGLACETCHALGCPRRKWSGRTKHDATNGPPGPCTAAIVVPPLPQLVPPSNMDFLSTLLLWQSFLAQGVYRLHLQYKQPVNLSTLYGYYCHD